MWHKRKDKDMNQIYTIHFRHKVVDEELFVKLTNLFVKRGNEEVNKHFSKCNLETADNCIKAFLAVDTQPDKFESVKYDKGSIEYSNIFKATRSWNNTLIEWFATVAIALADESDLEIISDDGTYRIKVICGVAQITEVL
jgi:hypothetical protein